MIVIAIKHQEPYPEQVSMMVIEEIVACYPVVFDVSNKKIYMRSTMSKIIFKEKLILETIQFKLRNPPFYSFTNFIICSGLFDHIKQEMQNYKAFFQTDNLLNKEIDIHKLRTKSRLKYLEENNSTPDELNLVDSSQFLENLQMTSFNFNSNSFFFNSPFSSRNSVLPEYISNSNINSSSDKGESNQINNIESHDRVDYTYKELEKERNKLCFEVEELVVECYISKPENIFLVENSFIPNVTQILNHLLENS